MDVIDWLLDSDPSIRWQVMRDLTDRTDEEVAAGRSRVATEGWGARFLSLQDENGQWGRDMLDSSAVMSEDGVPDGATRRRLRELHRMTVEDLAGFLDLVATGQLRLDRIITHRFPFQDAPHAYDLLVAGKDPVMGVVLHYDGPPSAAPRVDLHAAARSAIPH